MREPKALEREAATREITEKVLLLESQRNLNSDVLAFYVGKLVEDVLDYCHRDDFPEALVYTAVDLIRKRLADEDSTAGDTGIAARGPLSSVKMDDTEFKFAVSNVDATGCLSDLDFSSIKPKLNIYRRVVSF